MDTSSIDTQNKDQQAVVAVGQTQGEFNKVPINKQEKVENVPIFALHPKGSFYVPMSVELPLIGAMFNMELSPTPLLHPVTISVNFCHPLRVLSAPQAPVIEVQRPPTVIFQQQQPAPARPSPSLALVTAPPSLMPANPESRRHPPAHQRSHRQQHVLPYELESIQQQQQQQQQMQQNVNFEDRRMIAIAARGRSYSRQYEEPPKAFRMPHRGGEGEECHSLYQPTVNNPVDKHSVPLQPAMRREYQVQRPQSREHVVNNTHGSNGGPAILNSNSHSAVTSAIHSSRWSHLMAKRTHTP